MPADNLRSLVGTSNTKVGTFLFEFATPGIGQILKAAGADFAVLDMEHTGFGFDTVRQVVRYCQAASSTALACSTEDTIGTITPSAPVSSAREM